MSSPTNPIASASWAFLPDEEWLESRYNHEQKSYSLVGDQLAENLKDLAIQDIQPRVAQRLREVEKDCIGDYIRTWLSNRPRARRSAASDGANSTDYAALVESVDYLVQKIASPSGRESPDPVAPLFNDTKSLRGFLNLMVIEESSSKNSDDSSQCSDTDTTMATSMTSSDISLLREAGAATTGQVGFEGAGPSMRQPSETTPSSAGKKGSTTDPKTSASHLFGCGYCNKTFSRRSEQIRHWVQLNKTCTELKIKYSASLRDTCQRCQTCGLSALTDEECNLHKGESVRVNNLPTGWIRKHPRVSGQDDEALLQGRPRHFAGKERKNIGDPWKLIHVEFREDPNNPRPKKVLKVSRVEQ